MSPHFHLLTLGAPLLLTAAGETVRFRTRKHFALLIRLALEPGKRLSREYLIELLWSDVPAVRGRHSLSQAITVLRATIGRQFLPTQRNSVMLEPGVVSLDIDGLESGNVEIRGRFLEGFDIRGARGFAEWRDGWSARLHPLIRDCLVKRMDHTRRRGDFAALERLALLLAELDPLSEDAVRGIMEARAWAGDRSNALKAFDRHARRLVAELRAQPTVELARVAEMLRAGHRIAVRPAQNPVPPAEERRFLAEALLGRERELAELHEAWCTVRQREPRLVLVLGDHGIGKTTLTNAFASSCQMAGAVIARAQAFEVEKNLPYAVLAELVRQLTQQRAIGAADPGALAELSRLVPEILTVFPGVPQPTDWPPDVVPVHLADAFLKVIAAAVDETPAVLLVDDVHLADTASMAILHILARKLAGLRILLIFTARGWEPSAAAVALGIEGHPAAQALMTMELEPLSEAAAAELVRRECPPGRERWGDPPIARLVRSGSGNPLALELLTRDWVAQGPESLVQRIGGSGLAGGHGLALPQTLRLMVERQVQQLERKTRAVLDLAAVLGRRIGELWLYQVIGCSEGDALYRLTDLVNAHLLRDVAGRLEFRNELVRVQAYYDVPSAVRFELHRRVARMLDQHTGADGERADSEIAWHYIAGNDLARAIPYALTGAERSLSAGASQEAERVLLAVRPSIVEADARRTLLLLLAAANLSQSKAENALQDLDEVVNDESAPKPAIAQATRLYASAMYLINQNSTAKHSEMATRAAAVARECGDRELLARALFECARAGVESGNEEMIRSARDELRTASMETEGGISPFAHHADAYCSYFLLEVGEAVRSAEKAVSGFLSTNDVYELAHAYTGLGNCMTASCQLDKAKEAYRLALSLYRRSEDKGRISVLCSNLAAACLISGEIEEAISRGEESLDAGVQVSAQPVLLRTWSNLAFAYLLDGKLEKAHECRLSCQNWVQQGRSWASNIDYFCESASFHLALGNIAEALELIAQAKDQSEGRERLLINLGTLERLKVLLAYHREGAEAATYLADMYLERFKPKHALAYLEAAAASAWLEARRLGKYTDTTRQRLVLFENPAIKGKRAVLAAQGFLTGTG